MAQHDSSNVDQRQAPDVVEQLGILIWKIAVLLLGLYALMLIVPQPGVRQVCEQGALLLELAGVVCLAASLLQGGATPPGPVRSWLRAWPRGEMFGVALECWLAATIVQLSIALAGAQPVPWGAIGILVAVAGLKVARQSWLDRVAGAVAPVARRR